MLSQQKVIGSQKTLPLLETPQSVRVRYKKVGNLQYISHLDMQRVWYRVLVRAGIPMWYTKGFNPHAKITFGCPLPVGTQSECECVDIKIERRMTCEEIKERLNRELTDEMQVWAVYTDGDDLNNIVSADYIITIDCNGTSPELAEKIKKYFTDAPVMMIKHGKAGDKEIDIRELINSLDAAFEDGVIRINANLAAGNAKNLNAEMLISAMKRDLGILSGDTSVEQYEIIRTRLLTANGKDFT